MKTQDSTVDQLNKENDAIIIIGGRYQLYFDQIKNYQNSEMRIDFDSGLTDLKSYSTREEIQEIIGENKTNDSKACLEFSNEINFLGISSSKKGKKIESNQSKVKLI